MIKVDYEGAWKELKEKYGYLYSDETILLKNVIQDLEQKHTHNYVDIRRRSDKEVADYCLKKHAEMYLELVELKNKLKELAEGECEVKKC